MALGKKQTKEINCSDFRSDCDFTIRGKTEKEVLDKCQEHACSAHDKCDDSAEIRDKIKSHIRDISL